MGLSRELYDVIIQSDAKKKVIQMIPSQGDKNGGIMAFDDGDVLEIGMSKAVYLNMFKQVHRQWHDWNGEVVDLWSLYYMTLGYLITTNENHTIIHLHEKVVNRLRVDYGDEFLNKEFEIITTFLSSRLKRINKSSSLWFYMKKLTILIIFNPNCLEDKLKILIDRIFTSCKFHFANYYANNFMKWIMGISFIFNIDDIIGPRLIQECKANLKDISLWCTLEFWLYMETTTLQYYIDEYNTMGKQLTLNPVTLSITTMEPRIQQLDELFRWLLNVKCSTEYPYKALLRVLARSNTNSSQYRQLLQLNLQEQQKLLSELENHDSVAYTTTSALISTLESLVNLS